MAFDFKKEFKQFYAPAEKPEIIQIPLMNYLAIYGKGDPNQKDGEYQKALELLYGVAYIIKMSPKSNYNIEGFFDYVVPPLESLWWQDSNDDVGYINKEKFNWISIIRLPDFVKQKDVQWAKETAAQKKKKDFSKVLFWTYEEGLCVQCMHIGSYDDEPATIDKMKRYAQECGYQIDISDTRRHHEIYLSDPRKTQTQS